MPKNSYEKPDYWSQKAFSEGYPARSVYKLKEIDEKFGMIKKNYTVLDLGSAPGSWTTFLLRTMEGTGKVVSCDLNPLSKSVKGDNLVFIQGDLNAPEIRKQIKENGPYDKTKNGKCSQCGECCRNLDKSELYKELKVGNLFVGSGSITTLG